MSKENGLDQSFLGNLNLRLLTVPVVIPRVDRASDFVSFLNFLHRDCLECLIKALASRLMVVNVDWSSVLNQLCTPPLPQKLEPVD